MIRPLTIKIIAVILAVIAAFTMLFGYDLVHDRRVTEDPAPQQELF